MKVLKFGGASLKDGNSLKQICRIIVSTESPKAIVLSAFNNVTDKLNDLLNNPAPARRGGVSSFISNLKKNHLSFLEQAIPACHSGANDATAGRSFSTTCLTARQVRPETYHLIDKQCRQLERLFNGLSYTDEITERSRDLILSFGERLSVIVIAEALHHLGIDSKIIETDKIGLITDGYFGRASANLPIARRNIRKHLLPLIKQGITPIITGYFGCDASGQTTTFGRGGSDYSAAIISYALNADVLEIWKDVDGFMSVNPDIIPSAGLIETLSYKEAVELAYFGSTILHPRTVEPVLLKNIPIVIRNTFAPSKKGTKIYNHPIKHNGKAAIKGITYETSIGLIKVHGYGAGFGYDPEVIQEITRCLLDKNINIKTIVSAPTGIGLVLGKEDFDDGYSILNRTKIKLVSGFEKVRNQALIGLVGEGLVGTKGLAARVFQAISKGNINIGLISTGASSAAGYFLINGKDLKKTITLLYREFFTKTSG
ncbi:MAG: aspartate kinase [Planctomycetota bacterium]